ncbi:MAG: Gfo/Idh/MocA family oxidoreductase [Acutalibacteraceae bacterium]|nr:Gfo/Idh/MocA family oxidoreductase [Acutalibacteraceae bacterium]
MELFEKITDLAKELKITDDLIFKVYDINTDKIENLSNDCEMKSFECLHDENDITRLAVILNLANRVKVQYANHNIADKVFYDTMSDIKIWCANNGNKGLKNYNWLKNHVTFNLFKIGRLQYQFFKLDNPTLNYELLPVNRDEKVIYIHIPQGEKLTFEECRESIAEAECFFEKNFPEYRFDYFFCESWLLYEKNIEFMKSNSNIIRFQSLFESVYSCQEDHQAIERIFGSKQEKVQDYPENTSLQKAAKDYIQKGNSLGMGIGVIKRKYSIFREKQMGNLPVNAIIVGAGHRAMIYSNLAITNPELLKIVGVADPDPVRREMCKNKFHLSDDMCFNNAAELGKHGKLADAIINGTMDEQHIETAVPLLNLGYDMLLEKPFAVNKDEMYQLVECAKKNNSKVMICHVLRYAPFYYAIKERILRGDIGEITNIQTTEHVSYRHMSTSFVRGKWANSSKCKTSMLLQKCCHDLDLIMWLMNEAKPVKISSFGGRYQFREENAPKGAGTKCMVDCPLVDTCVYSTKRLYIDHPDRWTFYVWSELEDIDCPTIDDKINLMKSDSPYARCIYKCDNDVVDRQSVMIQFSNGATVTHNMIGATSQPARMIHIIGTKGEIYGNFEESKFTVSLIDPSPDAHNGECKTQEVDLNVSGDMVGAYGGHGGCDEKLTMDFVKFVQGDKPSLSCTSVFDSVAGHLAAYLADESLKDGGSPKCF